MAGCNVWVKGVRANEVRVVVSGGVGAPGEGGAWAV